MNSSDEPQAASRIDRFFGGRFHLHQPFGRGFRAGLDAMLLAACVPGGARGECADIGAGTGAVGFGAAVRAPELAVTLVEKDAAAVERLTASVGDPANEGFASRLTVAHTDILAGRRTRDAAGLHDGRFALVLTNPPFFPGDHRRSPDAARDAALFAPEPDFLRRWLRASAALVAPRGGLVLVARPADLPVVIEALDRRLGALTVLPVHTRPGAALRILVGARAGSREGLSILPGLDLHGPGSEATAKAIADGAFDIGIVARRP